MTILTKATVHACPRTIGTELAAAKLALVTNLARGVRSISWGRLFPEDGIRLQAFRFDLRNPLAAKYYWDTDFENAHYRIALHHTNVLGLQNTFIAQYVNNGEETLMLVSPSRKKAKTELLKTLYLGNMKLYRECYHEVDGDITSEGYQFI